jgi:hypothetical protein
VYEHDFRYSDSEETLFGLIGDQRVEVATEDADDPGPVRTLRSHRAVNRQTVDQRMQALGFKREVESSSRAAAADQKLERAATPRPEFVVCMVMEFAQGRVGERPPGEREPDLVLGTAFVIEGQQLLECQLRVVAGIA